ncbi:hypothetical protein KLL04_09255 [Clostridioides difficile]|nr:hypothetical protein [Clostridioides difficile]
MVCKYNIQILCSIWLIGFILTKWYVNLDNISAYDTEDGFILTKWYVNRIKKRLTQDTVSGFISTKW